MEVAERIRKGVENRHIESNDGKTINVTISIGVSRYIPEGNSDQHVAIIKEQFVNLADQALYEAKRMGRNCVMTKGLVELDLRTPAAMLS